MGNSKGDRGERELRKILRGREFGIIRAAGSGSAPLDDLPDLHAADGDEEFAFEAKRHGIDKVRYLSPGEVEALKGYCRLFRNAKPRVAVRWDQDMAWYIADPDDLPETPSGNRRLDPDDRDAGYYTPLDELLGTTNSR